MSKAFTRESDDSAEIPLSRPASPLPPGAKNYLTQGGATRLREELERLVQEERPRLAARSADVEGKRQLQMMDQRIQHLRHVLLTMVVVPPPPQPWDQVRFGATVEVRGSNGRQDSYRLVGVDEVDIDRGWVSWIAPIARALLNARLGERVLFKFPSGQEALEIVAIRYE